jgi:hypothetical protein
MPCGGPKAEAFAKGSTSRPDSRGGWVLGVAYTCIMEMNNRTIIIDQPEDDLDN